MHDDAGVRAKAAGIRRDELEEVARASTHDTLPNAAEPTLILPCQPRPCHPFGPLREGELSR